MTDGPYSKEPIMLIASCSLKGWPCATLNDRRAQLLRETVRSLQDKKMAVDAIVFSGGYFVQDNLSSCYLNLTFEERCDLLSESVGPRVSHAARELTALRKGALLIFGVDTGEPKSAKGDQLCVAWSARGPVGVGRKVFPTKQEGKCGYVVNINDFGTSERVVEIRRRQILLCACYDGYGIASGEDKSKFIRKVQAGDRTLHRGNYGSGDPEFSRVLKHGLRQWRKLVKRVDAAAVAIHRFEKREKGGFSTNYWRRHGIATASAKLSGGWVVAGANFDVRLPNINVDILASAGVRKKYLKLGHSRRTRDSEPVCDYELGKGDARVRVFEFV